MPTMLLKMFYDPWPEGDADREDLIGYCRESPSEVLAQLYKTHDLSEYLGYQIHFIVCASNVTEGIMIREARVPKGCAVQARLSDLPLDIARYDLKMPFKMTAKSTEYLCRELYRQFPRNPEYKSAEPVFDIIRIVFGIPNPSRRTLDALIDGTYDRNRTR